jgi:ankyrin repeat protein
MLFINELLHLDVHDARSVHLVLRGACERDKPDIIEHMLEYAEKQGMRVDWTDLASTAFSWDSPGATRVLLSKQHLYRGSEGVADASDRAVSTQQLVLYAVASDSVDAMRTVLPAGGYDINFMNDDEAEADTYQCTALARAADPTVVQLLLAANASVNPGGDTVLRRACETIGVGAVKGLLEAGAGVGKDARGNAALEYAVTASCDHEQVGEKMEIIKLLIDAKADAGDIGIGHSALHMCLRFHDDQHPLPTMETILQRVPELLESRNRREKTPLTEAVSVPDLRPDIVRMLLQARAKVDVVDDGGRSVITCLLAREHINSDCSGVLGLLLYEGGDATVCDGDGVTVLMICTGASRDHGPSSDNAGKILISQVIEHVTEQQTWTTRMTGEQRLHKR